MQNEIVFFFCFVNLSVSTTLFCVDPKLIKFVEYFVLSVRHNGNLKQKKWICSSLLSLHTPIRFPCIWVHLKRHKKWLTTTTTAKKMSIIKFKATKEIIISGPKFTMHNENSVCRWHIVRILWWWCCSVYFTRSWKLRQAIITYLHYLLVAYSWARDRYSFIHIYQIRCIMPNPISLIANCTSNMINFVLPFFLFEIERFDDKIQE